MDIDFNDKDLGQLDRNKANSQTQTQDLINRGPCFSCQFIDFSSKNQQQQRENTSDMSYNYLVKICQNNCIICVKCMRKKINTFRNAEYCIKGDGICKANLNINNIEAILSIKLIYVRYYFNL